MIRIRGLYQPAEIKKQEEVEIKGKWVDISYSKAKGMMGRKKIFSDRSRYVLAEEAPNILFSILCFKKYLFSYIHLILFSVFLIIFNLINYFIKIKV